uniref:LIM domain only protein 3 n=1 Tax=Labrus bergylta TaxID=56723 RepID=A0A3Q3L1U0_9LABR|nr:LIM domain only protein 3-like isoform X2 [Labrus bergylta]XP_020513516.1 LIM domain only protein 3-like isoform X2 [Labrus bergylta]
MLSVQPDTKPKGCAGCNRKIKDRYLLKALDKYWHEDCLKCACCDCRLGEVGSTLYTKANLILCRRDYLRLFGVTGNCAACSKLIPAFEMVMRAKENVYHLDCFACQLCNQRFCVGDKFFLKNNMILCQTDYEEGLMKEGYAPRSADPAPTPPPPHPPPPWTCNKEGGGGETEGELVIKLKALWPPLLPLPPNM